MWALCEIRNFTPLTSPGIFIVTRKGNFILIKISRNTRNIYFINLRRLPRGAMMILLNINNIALRLNGSLLGITKTTAVEKKNKSNENLRKWKCTATPLPPQHQPLVLVSAKKKKLVLFPSEGRVQSAVQWKRATKQTARWTNEWIVWEKDNNCCIQHAPAYWNA